MNRKQIPEQTEYVVTDGAYRYRVVRPWQEGEVGVVSQVVVDSRGRVFLLERSPAQLRVFSAEGKQERVFTHPLLTSGHGMYITGQDDLFVVTYDAHQVLRFDSNLELLQAFGTFNEPHWEAPFNHPTDVAVAADGDIYVSDGYGNARVHRFAPSGSYLNGWGAPGIAPGEFSTPHAIWVLPDERVLVADRDNDRIQVFDRAGAVLDEWRGVVRPMDIWADAEGQRIYVTEQAPRFTCLDPAGQVIGRARTFGVYPHGIWGAPDGGLYLAEQGYPHQIVKYERI